MKFWPVELFWLTFFSRPALIWKWAKVFNGAEFHFSEMTSYKTHIFVLLSIKRKKKFKWVNYSRIDTVRIQIFALEVTFGHYFETFFLIDLYLRDWSSIAIKDL